MSTFPKDQRFIFDSVKRHGGPKAIAAFLEWQNTNPSVLEIQTELVLPAVLVNYAIASLAAAVHEIENFDRLDEDTASDQKNDRLVMISIADKITMDLRHGMNLGD